MNARKRVVLLTRPGSARERTEEAVVAAGADLAAALDPSTASEDDVRNAAPDAVLVILDPVVEQALQKFDGVLGDPALEIMFEDADVAAKREGWEAARWARHLGAKLYGHQDVLPRSKALPASAAPPASASAEDTGFRAEMEALQKQVAAMPDLPHGNALAGPGKAGAVVIAAGVGGPDAVRQLLAALPVGFPRPILLRQRIEGGQYDKLVRQMQRATTLPVGLAQPGDPLLPGHVHVMPEGIDVQAAPAGLVFASTEGQPSFAALAAADSALLLLSGADPALVDRALSLSLAGGLALGQSHENCFDPATSNALVARGGEALGLAKLPLKLLARWPA
ncbi:MAG TPA: chemotaxis protein CheB [Thermomonas sp.]|nr:chemotaxis protein CheB [Thermomonas sp.]